MLNSREQRSARGPARSTPSRTSEVRFAGEWRDRSSPRTQSSSRCLSDGPQARQAAARRGWGEGGWPRRGMRRPTVADAGEVGARSRAAPSTSCSSPREARAWRPPTGLGQDVLAGCGVSERRAVAPANWARGAPGWGLRAYLADVRRRAALSPVCNLLEWPPIRGRARGRAIRRFRSPVMGQGPSARAPGAPGARGRRLYGAGRGRATS